MITYNPHLKLNSKVLRNNLTGAELLLWSHLRRKQLCNTQFYRQKPLGNYIVDFYAPSAKLITEIDGGQHFEEVHKNRDKVRDLNLIKRGLKVLRFDNSEVLESIDEVLEVVYRELSSS